MAPHIVLMGKEADAVAVLSGRREKGRLHYEAPRLIFRGAVRCVFEGPALVGVRAEGPDLVLVDGSRFTLDEKAAASWAHAIANPKGRADKIGIKPGMQVFLMGVTDATLGDELVAAGAVVASEPADLDLLFFGADSAEDLARVSDLVLVLAEKGALWIVSRKGKAATVKDTEVMAAARGAGLVDNKVVGFSETHTALRFVRPKGRT